MSKRPFSGDLEADARFERRIFYRGVLITVGVVVLVVVRSWLLPG